MCTVVWCRRRRVWCRRNPCRRKRREIPSPRLQAGERSPPRGASPRSGR
jgi:hypothetical protein